MTDSVFLAEALDANRAGRLSPGQLRDLQASVRFRSKGLIRRLLHGNDAFARDVASGLVGSAEGAITNLVPDLGGEQACGQSAIPIGCGPLQLRARRGHGPAVLPAAEPLGGQLRAASGPPAARWQPRHGNRGDAARLAGRSPSPRRRGRSRGASGNGGDPAPCRRLLAQLPAGRRSAARAGRATPGSHPTRRSRTRC